MLNSIIGPAPMCAHPCRRVALLGVFLAVFGLASTSWASGFASEWPTGRQFLGMSELERIAYVSGFMWGSAAQLADAHLRVDSCGPAVLPHAPADEIASNLAMAIAETAGADDLPVWIMLNDALIGPCNYRPGL
jgi:hypothetical protein